MKGTYLKSWPADHPIYSIGAVVGGQRLGNSNRGSTTSTPSSPVQNASESSKRNHLKYRGDKTPERKGEGS